VGRNAQGPLHQPRQDAREPRLGLRRDVSALHSHAWQDGQANGAATSSRGPSAPWSRDTGAHVDWADSKRLNEWERKALELSEERSKLGYGISFAKTRTRALQAGQSHGYAPPRRSDRRCGTGGG
jgi:hypothetical protein